jgi:DNA-binding CsgD family transcriptional regulator
MTRNAQTLPRLTPKQRDVLALIADNRTSKEIAGLLGISESAVNQRIEMIRSRLGGLPRGELARLYRQEYGAEASDSFTDLPTWQKIHLPSSGATEHVAGAEGISSTRSGMSQPTGTAGGDGSQLAAIVFQTDEHWLWREDRVTAFVRFAAVAAIVVASLVAAFAITQVFGPVGGS